MDDKLNAPIGGGVSINGSFTTLRVMAITLDAPASAFDRQNDPLGFFTSITMLNSRYCYFFNKKNALSFFSQTRF